MNLQLIRDTLIGTLDAVEKQIVEGVQTRPGHLIQFDMNHWLTHFTKMNFRRPTYVPECGAAACLAGHVAVRLDWPLLSDENMSDSADLKDFPADHPLRAVAVEEVRQYSQNEEGMYQYWGNDTEEPFTMPFDQAVTEGRLDDAYVTLGGVVRRYLDIPPPMWSDLTMPDHWSYDFQQAYKATDSELERVRITRRRVELWLDQVESGESTAAPDDPDDDGDEDEYIEEYEDNDDDTDPDDMEDDE